jgi:hypothetical protein
LIGENLPGEIANIKEFQSNIFKGIIEITEGKIGQGIQNLQNASIVLDKKLNAIAEVDQKAFTEVFKQQEIIKQMIEKSLVNEVGNTTLLKRFDDTDKRLDIMAKELTKFTGELGEGLDKSFKENTANLNILTNNVRNDISAVKNQVDKVFQGLGVNNETLQNINNQMTSTKTSIDNFDKNVKLLNQKIDQLKNVKDPKEVEDLTKQIEKLQSEVLGATVKFKNSEIISKQWAEQAKIMKENSEKNSELLKSEINTLKIQLAQSITNANTLDTEIQRQKNKVQDLENEKLINSIKTAENENAAGLPPGFNKENLEALQFEANRAFEAEKRLTSQIQSINQGDGLINFYNQIIRQLSDLKDDRKAIVKLIKNNGLIGHWQIIADQTAQIQSLLHPPKVRNIQKRALESTEQITKKQRGGDTELSNIPTLANRTSDESGDTNIEEDDSELTDIPQTGTTFEAPTDPPKPQLTPTQQTPVFQAAESKPVSTREQEKLERRLGITEDDAKGIITLREQLADVRQEIKDTTEQSSELTLKINNLHNKIRRGRNVINNQRKLNRAQEKLEKLTIKRTQLFEDKREFKDLIDRTERGFLEQQGERNSDRNLTIQQILDLNKIDKETKKLQEARAAAIAAPVTIPSPTASPTTSPRRSKRKASKTATTANKILSEKGGTLLK